MRHDKRHPKILKYLQLKEKFITAISELFQKYVEYEMILCIWFGLVSLFNCISTFVGYLIPKQFSEKNNSGTI